jgi:hypothetical protein
MQLSTDSIWSTYACHDGRVAAERSRAPDLSELCIKPHFRLRGLVWSILLSTILWVSFIAAGWELWSR